MNFAREDNTIIKKEGPGINFRWGSFNKVKEPGNYGKKLQRSFGNGSQVLVVPYL